MTRTLLKTVTWSILMLATAYIVSRLMGMSNIQSIKTTILLRVINSAIYFLHERYYERWDR